MGSRTASDCWKADKMGKEKEMQAKSECWVFTIKLQSKAKFSVSTPFSVLLICHCKLR